MNVRPDANLTSSAPTDGNVVAAAPGKRSRRMLGLALPMLAMALIALIALIAFAAFSAYAVVHPERMPPAIGALVEDYTGANPHPIKLLRPPVQPLSAVALLGEEIFYDRSLSASGQLACASCHNPQQSYEPQGSFPVQLGGPHMTQAGFRPPPSLTYLYRQAPFSIGPDGPEQDAPPTLDQQASQALGAQRAAKVADVAPTAPAMVPQGGLFWDGRADTLQDQSIEPMLNPVEMANPSADDVTRKLRHAAYIDQFKKLFGNNIVNNPGLLLSEAMFAVGRFQVEDPSFHEFSSKYDYWLEGKARLTSAELRGMRLFNDPMKANCAGCHLSQPTSDRLPPLFTDTQYEALGVPRNPVIPANQDPKFYDLGICGPFRKNLSHQTQYCGMFLTPTLRNAANRPVFFHNGVYHTLREVLNFYNFRDIDPAKVYPRDASGKVLKYNDIPVQYQGNIDVVDAPFNRKVGDRPTMSEKDIDDIIAFMKTLTDGYKP